MLHDLELKIVLKQFFVFILHIIYIIFSTNLMQTTLDSHKNVIIIILLCLSLLKLFSMYIWNEFDLKIYIILVFVDYSPIIYYFHLFDITENFGKLVIHLINVLGLLILLKLVFNKSIEDI